MRLIITEHMLFGRLRPWLDDITVPPVPVKPEGLSTSRLIILLEAYPEITAKLNEEWPRDGEQLNSAEFFIEADTDDPFNRAASWYDDILKAEQKSFLGIINNKINGLDEAVDKKYEINGLVRYVADILKSTKELSGRHSGRLPQYVLGLIEKQAMQLILDIGLRYRHLGEIEYYDDNTIFTAVMNRPAPERSPFWKTPAYWRYELNRLLDERAADAEYAALRNEIVREMERNSARSPDERQRRGEYTELIAHLENAVFLMEMDASFIKKQPKQLLDALFCREWVQGIRRECMEAEDPAEAARLFHNLVEAADTFMQLGVRRSAGEAGGDPVYSEARSFLLGIQTIYNRQPGKKLPTSDMGDETAGNFVDSFKHRFMTIEEFDSVLPGTREATMRYIKEGDIRLLKVSREVKFLYRADVEQYIEDRTV